MEHGINASTFAARVSSSTQSDLISSIAAAISTLKGPLHGGAPLEVMHMFDEIATKERAENWIRTKLDNKEPLMGFGHRVYKTKDPRAIVLFQALRALSAEGADTNVEFIQHIEHTAVRLLNEYKPGRNLYPNVEFGVAGLLRVLGIPQELYTVTFGVSRCAGWVTHIIEQSNDNRLMRPTAYYSGALPQPVLGKGTISQVEEDMPVTARTRPKTDQSSFFSVADNKAEIRHDDKKNISDNFLSSIK